MHTSQGGLSYKNLPHPVEWKIPASLVLLPSKKIQQNNYNPGKVRLNMKMAVRVYAFDIKDHFLQLASCLPNNIIIHLYSPFVRVR